MKPIDVFCAAVAIAVIVVLCVFTVMQANDCSARGGIMVRSTFQNVCITAERVK